MVQSHTYQAFAFAEVALSICVLAVGAVSSAHGIGDESSAAVEAAFSRLEHTTHFMRSVDAFKRSNFYFPGTCLSNWENYLASRNTSGCDGHDCSYDGNCCIYDEYSPPNRAVC